MYNKAFLKALAFTLKAQDYYPLSYENKNDQKINFGITQNQYNIYRFIKNLKLRSVELIESKEIEAIYVINYWFPAGCHFLSYKVSIIHFDWCVHRNVFLACKSLQQLLKIKITGNIFEQETVTAIKKEFKNDAILAEEYCQLRERWYQRENIEDFILEIDIKKNINRIKEIRKII